MAYCALIPLENVLVASFGGSINKYIGLLIVGCIVIWMFGSRRPKLFIGGYKYVLAFAGLAFASYLWTIGDPGNSYYSILFNITIFTLIFIQYPLYLSEKRMIYFGMIIVGLVLAMIMLGGGQSVNVNDISGGRVTLVFGGFVIDNNNLAVALSIPLMCSVGFIAENKKIIIRLFYVFSGVVMLIAILITGSRGGLLALIAGMTIYIIKKNNGLKIRTIVIGVVLVGVFLFVMQFFLSDGIASRFTLTSIIQSGGTGRTIIWMRLLDVFVNSNFLRQLFGYGYGMEARVLQNTWGHFTAAHNDFIQVLIDLGVVGLITYVVFWVKSIHFAKNNDRAIELGLLFIMFVSSMSMEIIVKKMLWLVLYFVFVPIIDKTNSLSINDDY